MQAGEYLMAYGVGDTVGRKDFKKLPVGTVLRWNPGGGAVLKTDTHYISASSKSKSSKHFSDDGYVIVVIGNG